MRAILIHGCHLQTMEWENVIWGRPENGILGRVPRGLAVAEAEKADLIYWGTGASERAGFKESEYTFRYAVAQAAVLPRFEGLDPYEIEAILKKRSYIDRETKNTTEEIKHAAAICRKRGITRLILVSSPTHVARCLQEALRLRQGGELGSLEIMATASDTCFANSTPEDVVVIEPPHRGDDPMLNASIKMHTIISELLRQSPERQIAILQKVEDLLER